MTVMLAVGTSDAAVIRCDTCNCHQVLARLGERGDVYPVIVGAYWDKDGRCVIICPACGERKRLPVRRVA